MTTAKRQKRASDDDDATWLEGASDPTVVDRYDLGVMIGMPPKDIDRALREGMPTHGRRARGAALKFRLPDVIRWLLRKRDQDGDTLESAKRKERAAMARRREIEVSKMEAELVPIADVEALITDQLARLQSELASIPVRLVATPEVRDVVRAEIQAAFGRLSLASVYHET
jgi:phage terminase Nu1 subunit (DNA packaging protein)